MDPILLQKQVTENAEELQNLAHDLISWEKEMKRKERSRSQVLENQEEFPPIRSKLRRRNSKEEKLETKKTTKESNQGESDLVNRVYQFNEQINRVEEFLKDDVIIRRAQERALNQTQKPQAEKMSDEQIADRQKREQSLFEKERGNELVKLGKYADAIFHYTQAIESYSQDAVFYTNRALCFLNTKKYKEAETDCTIALQLDPTNVKAFHRRATALKELNQLPEAHDDLQKALQLEPSNIRLKADLSKIEKLINDRVVKSVPTKESNKNTAYTYKEKGNTFVKKRNWKAAIENYTEACRLYPEDSSFYSNRALCYLKLNEPKKTILDCIRALELDANNTKALYRKALAHEILGHDSAAHDDLLAAFKLEPSNKSIEDELNKVEKKLGLRQESDITNPANQQNITSKKRRISGERFTKLGGEFVKPVKKPAHLLSQKPMKKITISDKSEIGIIQNVLDEMNENEAPLKECNGTIPVKQIPIKVETPQIDVNSLPHPKTSMQFITSWNKLLSNSFLQYQYLKRLSGNTLPTIFKDALETDVFSQILEVLASEFVKANEPLYDYLFGLSNVKRFSALILFASDEDKENIKLAIDHCNVLNEVSADELSSLKSRFYY